ncbi:MAG: glycosyltransferase family 4 protein [Prevotella sp.]|nr:glycosyltransferase family 4 protein [Prevotella sp.]
MKIVYVYPTVATKGGVERILVDKMNLLAHADGHQVYLLTYNQGEHPVSFALDGNVHHIDLDIRLHVQYQYRGLRRQWEGWKRKCKLLKSLKQSLKVIAPDVIVTTTTGELSLLLRLKGKTPLVVESHGGYDHLIDFPAMNWLHRRDIRCRYQLLKYVDSIVSLTESDAQQWRVSYPQVRVIPNVVHLNPLGRYSEQTLRHIIFVGRLAEQKGVADLIASWRIIHQRCPDWQLDIYGEEGEQESECRGVEGVNVFPPVANIFSKYCGSSILLLTSKWEPFGLVIPEAMSCGLPVVSFEGDGPCSIITDGVDGFLVKDRDIQVFADRVCQLIEDESLRKQMGRQAIESAQRYSADRVMPQWKQLFESLTTTTS